jgi:hypothetical protein
MSVLFQGFYHKLTAGQEDSPQTVGASQEETGADIPHTSWAGT